MANVVTFASMGIQQDTDRTVYVSWNWTKANTENYLVRWWYGTADGRGYYAQETTEIYRQSTYTAPENAVKVTACVMPVSKKRNVNGTETSYWNADWASNSYWLKNAPPATPSVPSIEIDGFKLTTRLDNIADSTGIIQFQVVRETYRSIAQRTSVDVFKTSSTTVKARSAQYSCNVLAGGKYKVRCRASNDRPHSSGSLNSIGHSGATYSAWSDYTEAVATPPGGVLTINSCKAESETSVELRWVHEGSTVVEGIGLPGADSFEIEYATKASYFDRSDMTTTKSDIKSTTYVVTGLEAGTEYFFRVRGVNEQGESAWSELASIVLGEKPSAPTTWSSTTTCITGEPLTLYWSHNSIDGSTQRYAEVELYINNVKETHEISSIDEEDDEKTMFFEVDTKSYAEGVKIEWRVRTKGVVDEYSDWSVIRTVDIYAPPVLVLSATNAESQPFDTLTAFPFYIAGEAGPVTQKPVSYHVSIVANESYETTDYLGNVKMVNIGDEIYSKHFDTANQLLLEISAGDVALSNDVSYTIKGVVSMDSGLTAEDAIAFVVNWQVYNYDLNAEVGINYDDYTASIRPYCENEVGELVAGVTLSVYRREFDGSFTEIGTGIENNGYSFVTDPHPALDFARYRIVSVDVSTGYVDFYDMPGYPVGEKAVVIQWDEAWSNFDAVDDALLVEPAWSGSLLKLPYNIDVSDASKPDVSLINYIGRKRSVSYYGTHLGETATWNMEIPKSDKETLYAIRRLAIWMGDVYVREPSGSGYWANINVSYSQKHCEMTIPITLSLTRVEGGA